MIPDAQNTKLLTPEEIRELIKSSGKSAAWCARRIGISTNQMSNLCQGRSKMSYPIQFALTCLAKACASLNLHG